MQVTIEGLDGLIQKIGGLNVLNVLRDPFNRAGFRLVAGMANYPQQRAGSTYRRTGTLGRRWVTEQRRTSDSLEQVTGNNTIYAPFVQSKRFQRPPFKGRWRTDEQVMRQEEPEILEDINRAVQAALK